MRVRDYVTATLALHQALSVTDSSRRAVRWEGVPAAKTARMNATVRRVSGVSV